MSAVVQVAAWLVLVSQPPAGATPAAIGDLITPEYSTVRFDTTFYLARMPYGQEATVWPGELDEGEWVVPIQFLARWTRGDCLISPPALRILETALGASHETILAGYRSVVEQGLAEPFPRIVFSPGIQALPLRTLALPPAPNCVRAS